MEYTTSVTRQLECSRRIMWTIAVFVRFISVFGRLRRGISAINLQVRTPRLLRHTVTHAPVINVARVELKKHTSSATSSLCPALPSGVARSVGRKISFTSSSGFAPPKFVSITPGHTALTRIPSFPYSMAAVFEKPAMACFEATY